MNVRQRVAGK